MATYIQSGAITDGGFGYDSAPLIIVAAPTIPILKAVMRPALDSAATTISIGVVTAGSHYLSAPNITISPPTDSSNKQALVSAILEGDKVSSFSVHPQIQVINKR
jgi:muramidase (phage lysozyme)